MSLLLYAIFRSTPKLMLPALPGVGGLRCFAITDRGLAAAVSKSAAPGGTPDLPALLAYEKVVAALHRSPDIGGVIPMRYGSRFSGTIQVRRLLRERGAEYRALLREVEGCEEMGIRFFLPAPSGESLAGSGGIEGIDQMERSAPGAAYLEARRRCYAVRERQAGETERQIERCRAAFAGVSRRLRTECRTVRDPGTGQLLQLVSLYFLVPRPSLPGFCRTAAAIRKTLPSGLLLSGPWPPFNFVLPEAPPFAASAEIQQQNLMVSQKAVTPVKTGVQRF